MHIPLEKLGTCPVNVDYPVNGSMLTNECKRDRDCKGKRKCCFSGGRRRCLLPLADKENACPYFNDSECIHVKPAPYECHSDDQCQGTERCCYYGCRLQCMPTVKVKSGTCPIPVTRCAFPLPPPKCKSDSECPGKMKCCTPFCGLECTNPIPLKSGECPIPLTDCVFPRPRARCASDSECPGNKKCCAPLCRLECTDPSFPLKSGTCPAPVTTCGISPSSPPPKPLCRSDSDCPGEKKCCTPKCRQECTDPLPLKSVKSGTCPAPVTTCGISPSSQPLKPLCTSDSDCPGEKKCCTPKCRQECTDPLPLKSVKSGTCPAPVTTCGISPSSLPPKPLCMSDSDCPGEKKCCTPKCRQECTDPLPLKSGRCPVPLTMCAPSTPAPKPLCMSDSDCPEAKKCCFPLCDAECTDPLPFVKPGSCPTRKLKCPKLKPNSGYPNTCSIDADCEGKRKCCNKCGKMECKEPQ